MKRSLLTLAILLLAMAAQAQFKMHSDGRITFQTLVNSTDYGITMDPAPSWNTNFNGNVYFKRGAAFRKNVNTYGWMNCAITNLNTALTWVVSPDWDSTTFYVRGDGNVYAPHYFTLPNPYHKRSSEPINGEEALSIVTGLNGYYFDPEEQEIPDLEDNENIDPEAIEAMYADYRKRMAGLSSNNFEEVFPEAVRTDPKNRLCIDYQSVVTMLVEAVKEQQREIEELRNVLERVEKNK